MESCKKMFGYYATILRLNHDCVLSHDSLLNFVRDSERLDNTYSFLNRYGHTTILFQHSMDDIEGKNRDVWI